MGNCLISLRVIWRKKVFNNYKDCVGVLESVWKLRSQWKRSCSPAEFTLNVKRLTSLNFLFLFLILLLYIRYYFKEIHLIFFLMSFYILYFFCRCKFIHIKKSYIREFFFVTSLTSCRRFYFNLRY